MIKAIIIAFFALSCSKRYDRYLSELRSSAGCREVYSCSSCSSNERCDVTERDADGWPIARECCPK